MIKLSDYVIKRLVEHGMKHIFLVSGGGAMHLNDSIGKCKDIEYICNHHEQACAIAAEGYARTLNKLAFVNVTTGPGGTNALTGVIGQWLDSVPVLYISGQVKFETTIGSCPEIGLRQLGDQEINIIDIVKSVTKFAVSIKNPNDIKKIIDEAVYTATHGRPGPVWVDIPLDIQASMIDETKLENYNESEFVIKNISNRESLSEQVSKLIELLKTSKRPVLVPGRGVRISGAENIFFEVVNFLKVPVVTTFNNFDIIPSDNYFFVGRVGTIGTRSGNFAVQNSDLYISIASRNNIRQISYSWNLFAREAKKVLIDIDNAELHKPMIKGDLSITADAKDFLIEFLKQLKIADLPSYKNWLDWCIERREKYQIVLPEYKKVKSGVQPYYFIEMLTKNMKEKDVVVAGNGSACVTLFQAGIIKKNQRIFWNSGCASMGYDLPAAIGACISRGKKNVICLAGDGSLMMNLQELETISNHKLPISIFVLNNNGYLSIKQSQENFFEKRYVACNKDSGVSFPDFKKIGASFNLAVETIDSHKNMEEKIKKILESKKPIICDVVLCDYKFNPKLSSCRREDGKLISKPLEDMYPFLDREEFRKNILIKEIEE